MVEAADEKILTKTIARYGRVDLLCIDELGYMELDRRGAELLFQVLTEREEKNSAAIASNESFGGWIKAFTDPRLCAAIVDRLTCGGNIIRDRHRLLPARQHPGRPGVECSLRLTRPSLKNRPETAFTAVRATTECACAEHAKPGGGAS
ncbi:ATP-binding protein [Streptomyces massasporeus]|uniref:ATP-binding protein n=1 Tax=Streptomyces massasporeus TaxID=67324 RepID=UPI0036CAE341